MKKNALVDKLFNELLKKAYQQGYKDAIKEGGLKCQTAEK